MGKELSSHNTKKPKIPVAQDADRTVPEETIKSGRKARTEIRQKCDVTLPDGQKVLDLTEQEKVLLEFFVERMKEEKTITIEDIKQYINAGGSPEVSDRQLDRRFRDMRVKLRDGTTWKIANTTSRLDVNKGIKPAYTLRKSQELDS
jgi:hypothetical protein